MQIKAMVKMERLRSIAIEEGCTLVDKATCVRVTKGEQGNRLYIARTQDVSRININGFRIQDKDIARSPKNGVMGTFLQELRFDLPECQVLENFRNVCRNLDKFVPEPKKPKGRPAGLRGSKKREIKTIIPPLATDEEKLSPKELAKALLTKYKEKMELAAQVGFALSKKTVEEFRSRLRQLGFSSKLLAETQIQANRDDNRRMIDRSREMIAESREMLDAHKQGQASKPEDAPS